MFAFVKFSSYITRIFTNSRLHLLGYKLPIPVPRPRWVIRFPQIPVLIHAPNHTDSSTPAAVGGRARPARAPAHASYLLVALSSTQLYR